MWFLYTYGKVTRLSFTLQSCHVTFTVKNSKLYDLAFLMSTLLTSFSAF